ncbi:MAG: hypothetical protein WAM61_09230, partial [Desulfobacterales bacterium]
PDTVAGFLRAWTITWSARWPFGRSGALLAVRGQHNLVDEDFFRIRKSFRDLTLEIDIERTSPQGFQVRVRQLKSAHLEMPARVTLFRTDHGRETASCLIEDDAALIDDIPCGHYRLVLTRNGIEIGRYRFFLKESIHAAA